MKSKAQFSPLLKVATRSLGETIGLLHLTAAAARMQQHALDDAVGAPPMLADLGEIGVERRHRLLDVRARCGIGARRHRGDELLQLGE